MEEEGEDGEKLKEKFSAFQHYLVETEVEDQRYKVFSFEMFKIRY